MDTYVNLHVCQSCWQLLGRARYIGDIKTFPDVGLPSETGQGCWHALYSSGSDPVVLTWQGHTERMCFLEGLLWREHSQNSGVGKESRGM